MRRGERRFPAEQRRTAAALLASRWVWPTLGAVGVAATGVGVALAAGSPPAGRSIGPPAFVVSGVDSHAVVDIVRLQGTYRRGTGVVVTGEHLTRRHHGPFWLSVRGTNGTFVAVEALPGGGYRISAPATAAGATPSGPGYWTAGTAMVASDRLANDQAGGDPPLPEANDDGDDHGSIRFNPAGSGQWTASWSWGPGVAGFSQSGSQYPALNQGQTVFLVGVAAQPGPNPADNPNAAIVTFAWGTVGTDNTADVTFVPPSGPVGPTEAAWNQGGEVFEMHTVADHLESLAGQLPEVPIAALTPMLLGAPLAWLTLRRREVSA